MRLTAKHTAQALTRPSHLWCALDAAGIVSTQHACLECTKQLHRHPPCCSSCGACCLSEPAASKLELTAKHSAAAVTLL